MMGRGDAKGLSELTALAGRGDAKLRPYRYRVKNRVEEMENMTEVTP